MSAGALCGLREPHLSWILVELYLSGSGCADRYRYRVRVPRVSRRATRANLRVEDRIRARRTLASAIGQLWLAGSIVWRRGRSLGRLLFWRVLGVPRQIPWVTESVGIMQVSRW